MRHGRTARPLLIAAACGAVAAAIACGFDGTGTLERLTTTTGSEGGADTGADSTSIDLGEGGVPVDASVDCGDVTSNPSSCGACGRSCLDAGCAAAVCTPFVVTSALDAPHGVAINATTAYIAENNRGHIRMAPLTGGANTLYFDTQQAPRAIAIAADRVFWVEQTKVRTKPFTTASVIDRTLAGGGGVGVLVDGAQVFYSSFGGNNVLTASFDLSGEISLASAQAGPTGLAVDATHLYWVNDTNGTVARRLRNGSGSVETVITGEAAPDSIALDATRLYWTAAGAIRTATIGVWTASNLVTGQARPRALVRDGSNLYWLDEGKQTLTKVSTSGGPPITLAKNEPQQSFSFMTAIAFDATYVYWISSTLGTLKRVPK